MSCEIGFVFPTVERYEFQLDAPTPWVMDYLRSVACAIGRPAVSSDLFESKVGY